MDPISIATACASVLSITTKTLIAVNKYGSTYHEAGTDLAAVRREVQDFQWALERLRDDDTIETGRAAGSANLKLKTKVLKMVQSSKPTLIEIEDLLLRHSEQGAAQSAWWLMSGKAKIDRLQKHLASHRSGLDLALSIAHR